MEAKNRLPLFRVVFEINQQRNSIIALLNPCSQS